MEANESDKKVAARVKKCPVCNSSVFEDMTVCFNCMYVFGSNPKVEERANAALAQVEEGSEPPKSCSDTEREGAAHCRFGNMDEGNLTDAFLVEFSRFLGEFIADRKISVKQT